MSAMARRRGSKHGWRDYHEHENGGSSMNAADWIEVAIMFAGFAGIVAIFFWMAL